MKYTTNNTDRPNDTVRCPETTTTTYNAVLKKL